MIDIESMVVNEDIEDVIAFLAPKISYPWLDNWFVRCKFEVIESGLLHRSVHKLLTEGKIAKDEEGKIIKGPNWRPPQFVMDKNTVLSSSYQQL